MKSKLFLLAALGSSLLIAQSAFASRWTAVASTCMIGADQVGDNGIYTYSSGSALTFASGETGEIKARCNVTNPMDSGNPTWNTLTVGYQDPDGHLTTYQVSVTLYRVNKSTGAIDTVGNVFNSNNFGAIGPKANSVTLNNPTFDFADYSYWVTLDLVRNDSASNPSVWFVSLN